MKLERGKQRPKKKWSSVTARQGTTIDERHQISQAGSSPFSKNSSTRSWHIQGLRHCMVVEEWQGIILRSLFPHESMEWWRRRVGLGASSTRGRRGTRRIWSDRTSIRAHRGPIYTTTEKQDSLNRQAIMRIKGLVRHPRGLTKFEAVEGLLTVQYTRGGRPRGSPTAGEDPVTGRSPEARIELGDHLGVQAKEAAV